MPPKIRGRHLDPEGENRSPGSRVPLQRSPGLAEPSGLRAHGSLPLSERVELTLKERCHSRNPRVCTLPSSVWWSSSEEKTKLLQPPNPFKVTGSFFPGESPCTRPARPNAFRVEFCQNAQRNRDRHPSKLTCAWWALITVFNRSPGAGFISWLHGGGGGADYAMDYSWQCELRFHPTSPGRLRGLLSIREKVAPLWVALQGPCHLPDSWEHLFRPRLLFFLLSPCLSFFSFSFLSEGAASSWRKHIKLSCGRLPGISPRCGPPASGAPV